MSQETKLDSLNALVGHLRDVLDIGVPQKDKQNKQIRYLLLFAYNGTGKTRLSMEFKDAGKSEGGADTLYFNAFTEDLFSWFNDIDNDQYRVLQLNDASSFFDGLLELEMESRVGPLLERYTDLQFFIQYEDREEWQGADEEERKKLPKAPYIIFFRERDQNNDPISIKPSRGEENIFVWCFFLAIAQIAIDSNGEDAPYSWVKYLYVDDPISSLDDNNAIAVASHLSQLLMSGEGNIKVVISTHHTLFFNVMWNELNAKRKLQPYFLSTDTATGGYSLRYTNDTPFFHHVALLKQLHEAAQSDNLYTFHFNILRNILEKTATFHGFKNFSACIRKQPNDPEGVLHARMVNVLSHGNYSLFEPMEMLPENKQYFKTILSGFMEDYRFDSALFPPQLEHTDADLEGAAQS